MAIALAEVHRPNALLLMDDFKGRDEAYRRQIPTGWDAEHLAGRGSSWRPAVPNRRRKSVWQPLNGSIDLSVWKNPD